MQAYRSTNEKKFFFFHLWRYYCSVHDSNNDNNVSKFHRTSIEWLNNEMINNHFLVVVFSFVLSSTQTFAVFQFLDNPATAAPYLWTTLIRLIPFGKLQPSKIQYIHSAHDHRSILEAKNSIKLIFIVYTAKMIQDPLLFWLLFIYEKEVFIFVV